MRTITTSLVLSLGMLGTFCLGCARNTPAPATPPPKEEVASVPESVDSETSGSAHSFDVGMEFQDKGDSENRRASHDAPPTGAWRPVEKNKSLDAKR